MTRLRSIFRSTGDRVLQHASVVIATLLCLLVALLAIQFLFVVPTVSSVTPTSQRESVLLQRLNDEPPKEVARIVVRDLKTIGAGTITITVTKSHS